MTTTKSQPRRSARLENEGGRSYLVLTQGVRVVRQTRYLLSPVGADWGRGFALAKLTPDGTVDKTYHVMLDGAASWCDCLGHLSHAHCKHLSALTALADAGLV